MQGNAIRCYWIFYAGVVIVCSFFILGCGFREWDKQEAKLKMLVAKKATREELIQTLGSHYIDYSQNSTNRDSLMQFLQREPPNKLIEVRKKVAKWPNVIFYSTPDMMTWVLLDENEYVVDFALSAQ